MDATGTRSTDPSPEARPPVPAASRTSSRPGARRRKGPARSLFGTTVAWVVLLGNVVVLVAALGWGVRNVDQSVLAHELAAGKVELVEVVAFSGEVTWDGPLLGRRTVWEPADQGAASLHQRVLDELAATSTQPLEVRAVEFSSAASVAGLVLPGWAMFAAVLVWGLGLGRVLAAPAPYRANRWAWGWIVALCPFVGAGLFALLGDPDGPGPRPRSATRVNGLAGLALAAVGAGLIQALLMVV